MPRLCRGMCFLATFGSASPAQSGHLLADRIRRVHGARFGPVMRFALVKTGPIQTGTVSLSGAVAQAGKAEWRMRAAFRMLEVSCAWQIGPGPEDPEC
ncbi:exported hypothetical protein [Cupriavidus necator]|uniref:Uncharacterized protein n=1 Tax=Cupriavidus necator TaxID=106590 RepID=A0A1K0IPB7_CUPNE|nr:exported hypothetical protein [Cupriavidus necator]